MRVLLTPGAFPAELPRNSAPATSSNIPLSAENASRRRAVHDPVSCRQRQRPVGARAHCRIRRAENAGLFRRRRDEPGFCGSRDPLPSGRGHWIFHRLGGGGQDRQGLWRTRGWPPAPPSLFAARYSQMQNTQFSVLSCRRRRGCYRPGASGGWTSPPAAEPLNEPYAFARYRAIRRRSKNYKPPSAFLVVVVGMACVIGDAGFGDVPGCRLCELPNCAPAVRAKAIIFTWRGQPEKGTARFTHSSGCSPEPALAPARP